MSNDEAYVHSNRYILEKQRQQMHIAELRSKLEREKNSPEMLRVMEQIIVD